MSWLRELTAGAAIVYLALLAVAWFCVTCHVIATWPSDLRVGDLDRARDRAAVVLIALVPLVVGVVALAWLAGRAFLGDA